MYGIKDVVFVHAITFLESLRSQPVRNTFHVEKHQLEVKNTNGTPKSGDVAITVNCLLVGLIGLVVLLAGHVSTTEEVAALSV